ncbi:MAG: hypothetical protein AVDCRST_MAG37-166, partial [uncultured Rubrobacteraceae bacterium]
DELDNFCEGTGCQGGRTAGDSSAAPVAVDRRTAGLHRRAVGMFGDL